MSPVPAPQPAALPSGRGAGPEAVFPADPLAPDSVALPEAGWPPAPPLPAQAGGCTAPRQAGVADLLAAFAAGRFSPPDVIAALQEAAGTVAAGRQALLTLVAGAAGAAAESAARWRAGTARPLEGIPFAVKDIIDVGGQPVTAGSRLTGNRIAPRDAVAVAALRRAGAIPFAMAATTEYAAGSPFNPRYGTVGNPWDPSRWTGGSSTGSGAALAARLVPLALGTDTGGSIRVPSAWCGVTGLKPTRERVSRSGVACLSWTLDHVGPMARSAADLALALPQMALPRGDGLAEGCAAALQARRLDGLRIGVPVNWFTEAVDAAVLTNWQQMLKTAADLGARLTDLPALPAAGWHAAGWTILLSELAGLHRRHLDRRGDYDAGFVARLETGLGYSAADYGEALGVRAQATAAFRRLLAEVDVVLTPGLGGEAGSLETLTVAIDDAALPFQSVISRNTMMFDLTGLPALMMPAGFGRSGLPTAVQVVAAPWREDLCLTVAAALQQATDWHRATPPGAAL
ncbi:amidase [Pseudoxanthobacter sp.]|uniref:amidase n=1 Tax=Pseudoxanthobacter sp. TaxID=1925742 RepID=UPI002FE08F6C